MTKKMIQALQSNEAKHHKKDKVDSKTTTRVDIRTVPAGILAYMGDSIFDMVVRNFFVRRGFWDSHKLHRKVTQFVRAEGQATLLREITNHLTDEEQSVLRRGRNSNAGNVPKNANVSDYRYSTAFEAVLGYLMLKGDVERLEVLIGLIEGYLEAQIKKD